MYQKVMLIGNIGRDPELKTLPAGKAICNFSLATNDSKRDADGNRVDSTIWWRCTAWGNIAEAVARYAKKGSKLLVEGSLYADQTGNPRVFQRADGTWSANYELNANVVRFLSSRSEDEDEDGEFSF